MINAHSFPLLQLPFLALEAVINQMDVRKQLDLSDLSKKVRWVVKTATSRQRYSMLFSCSNATIVVFIKSSKSASTCAYFKLNSDELTEFITKISGAFKNLDVSFRIHQSDTYRAIFELVPAMKQLNMSLQEIIVASGGPNDELCQLALRAAEDAKKLQIVSKTSPNFKPQELRPLKLEHLEIFYANWFTLDHLVNKCINCQHIEVISSDMTVRDLNEFLKKWMKGSGMKSFHWKYGKIFLRESILPKVLDGIPCVAVKKARLGEEMKEFDDDSCFMIEQVGGVKAIVRHGFYWFSMTIEFSLN